MSAELLLEQFWKIPNKSFEMIESDDDNSYATNAIVDLFHHISYKKQWLVFNILLIVYRFKKFFIVRSNEGNWRASHGYFDEVYVRFGSLAS